MSQSYAPKWIHFKRPLTNVLVPAKKRCQDAVLKRLDSLDPPPKPAKKKGEDATPEEPVVISKEILEQHAQERKHLTEQNFGDKLLRRLDGIINCGRYGYGSGPLEGSNNAITVLKRTAYGFLDFDYFRLKILACLPERGYARSTLLYGRLNRSLAVTKTGLFECCFHTNPR